MSKVLEAICAAGLVTAGGLPVAPITILSEGIGPSTGILILQNGEAYYIAKTSPDLAATLDTLASTLTTIATSLTSIGAGMTGPTTAPPPTLAVDVATITAAVVSLNALRAVLK